MDTLALVIADWHDGNGWHHHGHWWIGFLIFCLLIVGLLIAFIWRRGGGVAEKGDPARRILAERFARGEIGGEEYRERLSQLQ